jgi:outer membrane protein assembly factor BamE (lipoprotein component of BamABCDE complex)
MFNVSPLLVAVSRTEEKRSRQRTKYFPCLFFSFLLLLFLPACMTMDQKLDEKAVQEHVRAGQPRQEVRNTFGLPKRSESGSNGKTLDVYWVVMPQPAGRRNIVRKEDVRTLHVLYNAQGCVEKFTYHVGQSTSFGSRLTQQWQAGNSLALNNVNQIQRGVTTRDQLLQMFGPATMEGLDVYGYKIISWVFAEGGKNGVVSGRELFVRLEDNLIVRDYLVRDVQP